MAEMRLYANVGWTVGDVTSLSEKEDAEGNLVETITAQQAEEFLIRNKTHIQDRIVEYGWTVLETLLQMDGLL